MATRNELLEKSMATWNKLFLKVKNSKTAPEPEIFRMVDSLETLFSERPLRLWDVCCGAGRHTVAIASLGHKVYASDFATNGVALTRQWLAEENLHAEVEVADMTICPWPGVKFHGALSWNSLHHNTLENIQKAVDVIYNQLVPGGLFLCTLQSIKSDGYGEGREIEPGTFVRNSGEGAGIPHHYFDEAGIKNLFFEWEFISLTEQVVPIKWVILARKRV